jgi:hypothetical protein
MDSFKEKELADYEKDYLNRLGCVSENNDSSIIITDKEKELADYEKDYLNRLAGNSDSEDSSNSHNEDSSNSITDKDEKGEKILWKDKNVDLELLTQKMVDFFNVDGFSEIRHEISTDKTEYIVQAKKTGVLRTLSSTRKVITIQIKGNPNDFHVSVGTGEWGKGIAMVAVTGTIGLVGLGFNAIFKEKVWNTIRSSVQSLENTFGVSEDISKINVTPLEILKKRFAGGEITKDEFIEMKTLLE